jgi:hypothetical protein
LEWVVKVELVLSVLVEVEELVKDSSVEQVGHSTQVEAIQRIEVELEAILVSQE